MFSIKEYDIPVPAICASIIGKNPKTMKTGLKKAINQSADLAELRLDKLEELSNWQDLLKMDIPIIATNRAKREGGYFKGSESERIEILFDAIDYGASCIDIEFSTPDDKRKKIIEAAEKKNVGVIFSYHDFDKVSPVNELLDRAGKMSDSGCNFVKIVGFSNDFQESLEMLKFLIEFKEKTDFPTIAFAMGEKGEFTRFTAPLLGSSITYTSVEKKTAPGQLGTSTVRKILDKYRY